MENRIICGYDTEIIAENFKRVRRELEEAAATSPTGKTPKLIAATKTVPVEVINFASESLGLRAIGENRVQELLEKYERYDKNLEIHFIGHLQKNKVRQIVGKVSMIHSVDSYSLAEQISKCSLALGIKTDVLVEINIGRETSKGGIMPEAAIEESLKIASLSGISVRGMMTMAPKCEKNKDYLKYFQETYHIFVDFLSKNNHNIIEPVLSMGMSDSYREAVAVGATAVRIGSALFGRRT